MNISTVNELIQSLESAGELSIKERKYLELARAYVQLAAENVVRQEFVKIYFRAAADGASLDGSDIQEIGERLGLFGRETYQPVLHGYICGHETDEDSVYVMKSSPATDSIVAGIKADVANQMCVAFVKHKELVGLSDDDVVTVREATDAVLHCAEVISEGADK
ncbi:hypothetical protein [Klebsiella sp. CN_Kp116]|uniref:hypothetical protein n=1 Tax=Klebsiella sp. CN_Kp116 TaxID=3153430 RepID=UPI0032B399F1